MEVVMAKRKRTSRRSGLVGRAVSAGRRALKEAESRVPPDLRRQVERRMKDADKTARAAIKTLQTQAKRASTPEECHPADGAGDRHDRVGRLYRPLSEPNTFTPPRRTALGRRSSHLTPSSSSGSPL